ncbi:hypothetical protein ACFQX9_17325 [Bradyrhizobium sp. GCM10028915]|uniref:hypothetical protein n=1 Tax=Bradyrhizobium sp. GCM10028915 TaxID=3273385 RepID=UPI00360DC9CA
MQIFESGSLAPWLKITVQSHEHSRWWDPVHLNESDDCSSLKPLIGSAVEEHLLPHTPDAAPLSGGLDSKALVAKADTLY